MVRKRSWPAVSLGKTEDSGTTSKCERADQCFGGVSFLNVVDHICKLTVLPSIPTCLISKSTPIVLV